MTQTIQAVITQAQANIKTAITKIQNAPEYATEARIAIPTSLAYADNIRLQAPSAGLKWTFFDLKIDIIVPLGDMESALRWLADVPQALGNVFRDDPTISGTCQTYDGDVTAQLVRQNADGAKLVGYSFTVPSVKIEG